MDCAIRTLLRLGELGVIVGVDHFVRFIVYQYFCLLRSFWRPPRAKIQLSILPKLEEVYVCLGLEYHMFG